eukprot:scaffold15684_cov139-Isochrysis_galbana.AAC.2
MHAPERAMGRPSRLSLPILFLFRSLKGDPEVLPFLALQRLACHLEGNAGSFLVYAMLIND